MKCDFTVQNVKMPKVLKKKQNERDLFEQLRLNGRFAVLVIDLTADIYPC
jgi:hypothetical protein